MKQEKTYENIFAKMLLYHNNETVPFLKSIGSSSIKIKWRKTWLDLSRLETNDKSALIGLPLNEYINEYLLMNSFIIKTLDINEYNSCIELIRHKDKDNKLIGAVMIYNLIETKKVDILSKI